MFPRAHHAVDQLYIARMTNMRRLRYLLLTIGFVAAVTACGGPNGGGGPDPDVVLEVVNGFRSETQVCGDDVMPAAPALRWDNRLSEAAQLHSEYMAETGELDHVGRNGSTFDERILAAGYSFWTAGENIAQGFPTSTEAAMAWLASSGHCRNMMNPNFEDMGLGGAESATGVMFWTLNLGAQ